MITVTNGNAMTSTSANKARAALLYSAVGDALGWPMEDRSARVGGTSVIRSDRGLAFIEWTRRAGGRFYSHEEKIGKGEYSDDTQLTLCTARSLLQAGSWWQHLINRELPAWSFYERGGGGATKRAVEAWLGGSAPWRVAKQDRVQRYFRAGGNGVAMRISPHCVVGIADDTYRAIADAIILDGITTHGHPRALVGALAYGYALWRTLRRSGTLGYGELLEDTIEGTSNWQAMPEILEGVEGWRNASREIGSPDYRSEWNKTIEEMLSLLRVGLEASRKAALAVERSTLEELGCFDRRMSGAGTIAAAAAVFLASRFAADPANGIAEAASARGTDTDTIASMTAALLGAINGTEWLPSLRQQVQDARYIEDLSDRLISAGRSPDNLVQGLGNAPRSVEKQWLDELSHCEPSDSVLLPDGRKGRILDITELQTKVKNLLVQRWAVETDDHQTLYIKRITRTSGNPKPVQVRQPSVASSIIRVGVRLRVQHLDRSVRFYENALGLRLVRRGTHFANFNDILSLVHSSDWRTPVGAATIPRSASIYVEVADLELVSQNLRSMGIAFELSESTNSRRLYCNDPDGNPVEVVSENPGLSSESAPHH